MYDIIAICASGTARCGAPRTEIIALSISRSAGEASSIPAAMCRTFSLTRRVPYRTAPLAIVAARLPPVPIKLKGVTRVSP